MNLRHLFLRHLAQTSPAPMALEISHALGITLTDVQGRSFTDLIGGISVANTGHRHPHVLAAIHKQLDAYLHVMVYGEFVQSPQVQYAQALAATLPSSLSSVYFTNSGAEAVEGALKLAKRVTGRTGIVAFNDSYHGSTHGALSVIGSEYWRNAFRPLLPMVSHADYGSREVFDMITDDTACVLVEIVQAEAGVRSAPAGWLKSLEQRCKERGALLIVDEIQTGFGRTGTLWAFTEAGILPNVLLLGKALGGGLPLGAFIASEPLMQHFTDNPVLGHITTFGGHPLSCAAGKAALEVVLREDLPARALRLGEILRDRLQGAGLRFTSAGLWAAVDLGSFENCQMVIKRCIEDSLITDWFLFADTCLRISPPLTITEEQLNSALDIIIRNACLA